MKLLSRTLLLYLSITLIVFLGGGIVFYQQLRAIMDEEINEQLVLEGKAVMNYFSVHEQIPQQDIVFGDKILFDTLHCTTGIQFRDTLLMFQPENEILPYRVYSFPVPVNGKCATCFLLRAQLESEDLRETILDALMIVSGILVVVIILLAAALSGRLWKNFYRSLDVLRKYDAESGKLGELPRSSIPEFKEMNTAILNMSKRIESQFKNLRSFTENASHELQTPLAILRTKIELLLQDKALNASQHKHINDLYQAVNRLSKLNQELLTLSKLNNRQFKSETPLDLSAFMNERLEALEELIEFKELKLIKRIDGAVLKKIHPTTADILFGNLFQNAIRHNPKGGEIFVELSENIFSISNSASGAALDPDKIFERFYRGTTTADSNGLGLSLAKEAAESCGWKLGYTYKEPLHIFTISF